MAEQRSDKEKKTIGVGIAVFVFKRVSDKAPLILLGKRRSSVGHSTYGLPGGHLHFGESWEDCAEREVMEETGLSIRSIEFATANNNIMLDDEVRPSHYVTIFMKAEVTDPEKCPQNLEPDKCEGWDWYNFDALPAPLFRPLQSLVDSRYNPF